MGYSHLPRPHAAATPQLDNNGKLAVELLFDFEGGRPNTPSGSRLREGLLMDQRKDFLDEVGYKKMCYLLFAYFWFGGCSVVGGRFGSK